MTSLSLIGRSLQKIEEIDSVTNLSDYSLVRSLNLHGNSLNSLEGIGRFTSLEKLNVSANDLTSSSFACETDKKSSNTTTESESLPSSVMSLGCLSLLTSLDLASNRLTSFPIVGSLESLVQLDLSYNQISSLVTLRHSANGNLSSTLCSLNLRANCISDPRELSALSVLTSLTSLSLQSADNQLRNPVVSRPGYRAALTQTIPTLTALDGLGCMSMPIVDRACAVRFFRTFQKQSETLTKKRVKTSKDPFEKDISKTKGVDTDKNDKKSLGKLVADARKVLLEVQEQVRLQNTEEVQKVTHENRKLSKQKSNKKKVKRNESKSSLNENPWNVVDKKHIPKQYDIENKKKLHISASIVSSATVESETENNMFQIPIISKKSEMSQTPAISKTSKMSQTTEVSKSEQNFDEKDSKNVQLKEQTQKLQLALRQEKHAALTYRKALERICSSIHKSVQSIDSLQLKSDSNLNESQLVLSNWNGKENEMKENLKISEHRHRNQNREKIINSTISGGDCAAGNINKGKQSDDDNDWSSGSDTEYECEEEKWEGCKEWNIPSRMYHVDKRESTVWKVCILTNPHTGNSERHLYIVNGLEWSPQFQKIQLKSGKIGSEWIQLLKEEDEKERIALQRKDDFSSTSFALHATATSVHEIEVLASKARHLEKVLLEKKKLCDEISESDEERRRLLTKIKCFEEAKNNLERECKEKLDIANNKFKKAENKFEKIKEWIKQYPIDNNYNYNDYNNEICQEIELLVQRLHKKTNSVMEKIRSDHTTAMNDATALYHKECNHNKEIEKEKELLLKDQSILRERNVEHIKVSSQLRNEINEWASKARDLDGQLVHTIAERNALQLENESLTTRIKVAEAQASASQATWLQLTQQLSLVEADAKKTQKIEIMNEQTRFQKREFELEEMIRNVRKERDGFSRQVKELKEAFEEQARNASRLDYLLKVSVAKEKKSFELSSKLAAMVAKQKERLALIDKTCTMEMQAAQRSNSRVKEIEEMLKDNEKMMEKMKEKNANKENEVEELTVHLKEAKFQISSMEAKYMENQNELMKMERNLKLSEANLALRCENAKKEGYQEGINEKLELEDKIKVQKVIIEDQNQSLREVKKKLENTHKKMEDFEQLYEESTIARAQADEAAAAQAEIVTQLEGIVEELQERRDEEEKSTEERISLAVTDLEEQLEKALNQCKLFEKEVSETRHELEEKNNALQYAGEEVGKMKKLWAEKEEKQLQDFAASEEKCRQLEERLKLRTNQCTEMARQAKAAATRVTETEAKLRDVVKKAEEREVKLQKAIAVLGS
eukprot:g5976.t1